jgi:CBS domain-containing protein
MKHSHNDRDIVTIGPDATLREAAVTLRDRGIGCLVVVDADGVAVGILTDRDLCLRAVAWERDPSTTRVREVMTEDVRGVDRDAPQAEWPAPMRRLGVRRVPLFDEERRPCALYSADDWLRWLSLRIEEVAATADPAHRHGPLTGRLQRPARLLDELTLHVEERALLDRDELLEAIERLRSAVT